ncbi:MAG: hypothetical protein WCR52_05200 [Bacteroidota bacterium]
MQKFILFFAFASLMFVGCKKDNSTTEQLQNNNYPGTYTGVYTVYSGVDAGTDYNATMVVTSNVSGGVDLKLTAGTIVENMVGTITSDSKLQLAVQNVGGLKMTGAGELTDSDQVLTLTLTSVTSGLKGGFFKGKK